MPNRTTKDTLKTQTLMTIGLSVKNLRTLWVQHILVRACQRGISCLWRTSCMCLHRKMRAIPLPMIPTCCLRWSARRLPSAKLYVPPPPTLVQAVCDLDGLNAASLASGHGWNQRIRLGCQRRGSPSSEESFTDFSGFDSEDDKPGNRSTLGRIGRARF